MTGEVPTLMNESYIPLSQSVIASSILTGFTVRTHIARYTGTVVGIDLVQTCSTILTRTGGTFINIYKRRENIVQHNILFFLIVMHAFQVSAISLSLFQRND